jgi:phytoene dehydrogenase-like protein
VLDALVIGSGPNGLSAAIVLAQAGCKVLVMEAEHTFGGGVQSAELTLPGFVHDICSAVHPFAIASPFWRTLPLAAHGLHWIEPPSMIGHPFDDGSAIVVERSIDTTAARLGRDGDAYVKTIVTVVEDWARLERSVHGPFSVPQQPFVLARFG